MSRPRDFYGSDLAYIHNVGCGGFAEGCAPGILAIFRRAGIDEGPVVDLGCGGGLWAGSLIDAGYQVCGVDISPAMIALARRRAPQADFQVGSLWRYRFSRCRAVTALGEVLCYRNPDDASKQSPQSLFRKVFNALQSGGLLIFDVAEVGLDRNSPPRISEGDGWLCLVQFHSENDQRLIRRVTAFRKVGQRYRRSQERHVVQLYRAREVAGWLRRIGFRVRTVRHFGTHALRHRRVGFIARKP